MDSLILFVIALVAFLISCRGLIAALTENSRLLSLTEGYSHRAMRLAKAYRVTAWLILMLFLFATSVETFLLVFKSFS